MSNLIPGNQKHLTLEERRYIEKALSNGTSFKDIARFLCKDPTTISREVRKHRLSDWYHKGTFYNAKNFCIHRYHCRKTNVCDKIILCSIKYTDHGPKSVFRTHVQRLLIDPDRIERAAEMGTVHSSRDSKKVLLTFYLRKQ